MLCSPEIASLIVGQFRKTLDRPLSDNDKLFHLWQEMFIYRAEVLAVQIRNTIGDKVYSGPFKDMQLTPAALKGAFAPHLLGIYEHELHPVFNRIIAAPYRQILNIGCSFGYYAVGLALKMPQAAIHAFDIDEAARNKCRDLAALNHVGDRVTIGGEFKPEDFARYADLAGDQRCLVLMDIEAAEYDLLNPETAPALRGMDIVVELHDVAFASMSSTIADRFRATHEVTIIYNKPSVFDFTPITGPAQYIDPADAMAATWEKRSGATPWGIFWAKNA